MNCIKTKNFLKEICHFELTAQLYTSVTSCDIVTALKHNVFQPAGEILNQFNKTLRENHYFPLGNLLQIKILIGENHPIQNAALNELCMK